MPSGRLGPFHVIVHAGLQSAIQLIGPIFPTVSIAVKLCFKGIMLTCLGPSKTRNNNKQKVVCCPVSYTSSNEIFHCMEIALGLNGYKQLSGHCFGTDILVICCKPF